MSTQTMKRGLRQSIIAARQKMAAADRFRLSSEITQHILDLAEYKQAEIVLGYMSFGAEFVTTAWVQQVLHDGKQLLLPKVNSSTKQLDLYRITSLQQDLAAGVWEIPEPLAEHCERVEMLTDIDFVLLPGVAFGRDGSRLGYGGGYYDKLLERIACADGSSAGKPALVAAAFSMQLVGEIPQEPTDRKVEWLLTENEVIDCTTERIHSSDS
ncbi:MAG: 5-formyltetrahydrofolate cyclo-ligase [Gallionellaceae bacterium]